MASGKTHDRTTFALSVCILPFQPVISAGCLVGGLLLSPDLDMANTHPSKRMLGLYGPYAMICGHHRSPLSHLPIVGTVGRVGYLAAIVWAVCHFTGVAIPPMPWLKDAAIGVEISALLHYFLDWGKSGWLIC